MIWIQPMIIWISLSVNIYGSILMPLMTRTMSNNPKTAPWEENHKDAFAFFAICFMGAGEIIGGLTMGPLRDKIGTKLSFFVEILLLFQQ